MRQKPTGSCLCLFGVVGLAVIAGCEPGQCGPVLRQVISASGQTNLLRNGDFEKVQSDRFTSWSQAPQGCRVAAGEGRGNSTALGCDSPDQTGWRGASQTLTLNRQTAAPVRIRGWSRAEGVSGSPDSGYSLYVDVIYTDGTPLWGRTGNFKCGTHDWEHREFLVLPEKPIRSLSLYCLLRGHSGKVWFDDIAVEEISASGNTIVFQGTPMALLPQTNPPPSTPRWIETSDGLKIGMNGSWITSVRIDGQEISAPTPGGFLAWDVASGSDVYGFTNGLCPELQLGLETTVVARSNCIRVTGRLADARAADRAIMLLFALPIDATGWMWGDDIRRERAIEGRGEFTSQADAGCGTTGTLSLYPIAAVHNDRLGLALALDMGQPAVCRLVYHAGTRQLFIAYDFGLVPETERFRGAAEFGFVIYRYAPRWGFRAAWQKYMDLFPDYFVVRSRDQGIWMPFTDVSTVQGWQDFGFRYHEGDNNVAFDDQNHILSFRYLEPMTWWMPMKPEVARTLTEALRVRDEYAQGPAGSNHRMALVSQSASMLNNDGDPALLFRNEPWANGAVWSLNPNPFLPGSPNAATVYWNSTISNQLYGPNARSQQDGEYIDSIEGYVTADLNFCRDHFRFSTVPLAFDLERRRPALFKGLAVFEFTRWLSEDLHRMGKLVFANGVPYRFSFLCPWLDVLGTETDWMSGGQYRPVSDAQMCLWRTLSGQKPYLLLMNTDYDQFRPEYVERYFQRSLFYGMYPSMFSHNAAENPYWKNPTWYNRDRPLFKKYLPIIRQVAQAGWQPVTSATFDPPGIQLERFGPDKDGMAFFTLLNDTVQVQQGVLRVLTAAGTNTIPAVAYEMLSNQRLHWTGQGWAIAVPSNSVAVVRIGPGPRFTGIDISTNRLVRLTIQSPPELPQALEASADFREWETMATHTPSSSPFTLVTAMTDSDTNRFYRLSW